MPVAGEVNEPDEDESLDDVAGLTDPSMGARTGSRTAAFVSAMLAVLAAALLVAAEAWARRSSGYGPLLPALAGIALALAAGAVGVVGLLVRAVQRRFVVSETVLFLVGIVAGLWVLLLDSW